MQVLETSAVILVFVVLVIFALAWFAKANQSSSSSQLDQSTRLALLATAKEVMNMPELRCSIAGKTDSTCVDLDRVKAFQRLIANDPTFAAQYQDRFAGYNVYLQLIYPHSEAVSGGATSVTVMSFGQSTQTTRRVAIPVIAYDPVTGKHIFSMLVLEQHTGGTA